MNCSSLVFFIEVLPSFVGFRLSATMMARKKKQEGNNDAYTEKVPQDVAKNKSRTLKSVPHDDHQLAPRVAPLSEYC